MWKIQIQVKRYGRGGKVWVQVGRYGRGGKVWVQVGRYGRGGEGLGTSGEGIVGVEKVW